MVRRQFSREFKLEAVRLVREYWVTVAQASRDLEAAILSLMRSRGAPWRLSESQAGQGRPQHRWC